MIRALLASSAAAALVVATAAAGTPAMSPAASGSAWQMAQAQPYPEGQPPAAGEPAAPPADQPAATDQPPAETAETPADQPAATDQPPADTAETPADQPSDLTAEEPTTDEQPEELAETAAPMDHAVFITEQAEQHWLATDYIGESVYNRADEAIGSIDDLIVEEDAGLVGFVVGVGGFLGIGKKRVAIDLAAVDVQEDEDGRLKLVVDGTRDALMEAPDFTDKATQRAELERQQREMEMQQQQPPAGLGMPPPPGAPAGPAQ